MLFDAFNLHTVFTSSQLGDVTVDTPIAIVHQHPYRITRRTAHPIEHPSILGSSLKPQSFRPWVRRESQRIPSFPNVWNIAKQYPHLEPHWSSHLGSPWCTHHPASPCPSSGMVQAGHRPAEHRSSRAEPWSSRMREAQPATAQWPSQELLRTSMRTPPHQTHHINI